MNLVLALHLRGGVMLDIKLAILHLEGERIPNMGLNRLMTAALIQRLSIVSLIITRKIE